MRKRIVVCCDGTWNSPDQLDADGVITPTNVTKLALSIAPRGADGCEQRVLYDKGVGTGRVDRLTGGILGVGLPDHVRRAYRGVVEAFEPGDELFLLGFSRGAFTARSTVGMIRNCGVLRREHAGRVDEAYALYRSRADVTRPRGLEAELYRRAYSHETRVRFLGVFDTVGALGIPIDGPRLAARVNRRYGFHDTQLSSAVDAAFHALAIDERRGPFRPTLWTARPEGTRRLEQVWFSGVHCDVGGGYRDGALAGIPLLWMAERARECGLTFAEGVLREHRPGDPDEAVRRGESVEARPLGARHDSRTGVYRYLRTGVRAFGTAVGERVASSAVHRFGALGGEETPETFRPALGGTITSEVATVGYQADEPVTSPAGTRPAEPTRGAT
jgi:uncharacterized protein (DUF2235 family)